jgi:glycosyltransferase involved in cell wall biosynthesis
MNYNTFNDLFEELINQENYDFWENAEKMNIFPKKHICFLISDQHLIPHGGIGQFAKSFIELCDRLEYRVDFVLDKKPTNNFLQDNKKVRFYYTEGPLSYKDHTNTFMYNDNVNYEKCQNFQQGLSLATKHNTYDLYVANTLESVISAYTNGCRPLVSYTHLYRSIYRNSDNGKFLDSFHTMQDRMNEMPDIIVGTQSETNQKALDKFVHNCEVLPMPMPERELLYPSKFVNRSGVLYIGRWEEGKRPKLFLDICKQADMPVKILTNSNGAKKFEQECIKLGITDYTIKFGITGTEKVEFITSSAVHLNCSKLESYCFALFECIGHMPCITLDDQNWSDNFVNKHHYKVSKSVAVTKLKDLYYSMAYKSLGINSRRFDNTIYTNQLDNKATNAWRNLL